MCCTCSYVFSLLILKIPAEGYSLHVRDMKWFAQSHTGQNQKKVASNTRDGVASKSMLFAVTAIITPPTTTNNNHKISYPY